MGRSRIYRNRVAIYVGMATVMGAGEYGFNFWEKKPLDFLRLYFLYLEALETK